MVVIDGNSLINRAFYALPPLTTKEGIHTNAVYGFVNILHKIFEDYKPEYISVAFDRKAPTFRHIEYEAYKAGRKRMPDELGQQLPILKEILDIMKIHRTEIDGFEADDLIGTLSKYGEGMNLEVYIVTGDKDALQLSTENTKVLFTKKGISDIEIYTPEVVFERYEVTPKQFIDLKGLMGDKSDNIPGVPGIGEKTAAKLIKEFGSIEYILENTEKIQNHKLREKMETYAEQAIFSKRLATIKTDVPIELSLEALKRKEANDEELIEIFRRLEFYSFMQKINKEAGKIEKEPTSIPVQTISKESEINSLVSRLKSSEGFYFKAFYDGKDIRKLSNTAISILFENGDYFFIDTSNNDKGILDNFKVIFEDSQILKYGYDTKSDYLLLRRYDISLEGVIFDASIAAYLLDPTRSSYGIHDIYATYIGRNINSEEDLLGKGKNKIDFKQVDQRTLAEYGWYVCNAVKDLKSLLVEKIKEFEMEKLFYEVEIPLIKVLADMEYEGFLVDKEKLGQLGADLNQKINHLITDIHQLAGETFNINSTKQLGEVLFDKLKLPVVKKTKTGYSTNIEVLEKLSKKHPIIDKIIEYRQYVKLKSTYVDGLTDVINEETKKIHSSFNQTVTATGRISSTEPNLQNIPVRLEMGREIRKVFIPSNKNFVLLDADYSQIELRVLAHISQDKDLIEAFQKELDIHTITASKVFGVPFEEVTVLQRGSAKAVNFGIVYGISDYGLAENLNITKKEAQRYIDEYFEQYKGVRTYMDEIVEDGKKKGYVTTLLNRRRYITELKSTNYNIRSFGERTAMNTPIQGSAADIIKIAMIKVYGELKRRNMKSKLILQVHDELIVETHGSEIEEVKQIVKNEMEKAITLNVALKVEMNIGESWYDTK